MILADKINNERKKNGWSQEELADQLCVSRQSISKWEGAQAIPDIQKIIKMAEIFGVTTDYLLKDEMEPDDPERTVATSVTANNTEGLIRVSMEEANEFLTLEEKLTPWRANMVSLCIFAPMQLLFFIGVSEIPGFQNFQELFTALGVINIILLVAIAVFFFVADGAKLSRFEYLETNPIETLYGISGMVKEKKKASEQTRISMTGLGVILCILSVIPLLTVSFMGAPDYWVILMVGILLLFVSIGVNLLVRAGSMTSAYNKLLQEGDYTVSKKRKSPIINKISTVYWLCAVAVYLGWSFWYRAWDRSWIVWPIAGVLFAVVITLASVLAGSRDKRN